MSDKIFSDVEFEFLDLFDITMINGKLIKEDTKEIFTYNPEISDIENYVFECGDIKVIFEVITDTDGIIPVSVSVCEDGLKYSAGAYLADSSRSVEDINRSIYICDESKNDFYEVMIKPFIGKNFVVTTFKNPHYYEEPSIKCQFNKYRQQSKLNTASLFNMENYKDIFIRTTNSLFPKKIANAVLRCAPFIYQGYYLFSRYPLEYYQEFLNYFEGEEVKINKRFVDQVKSLRDKKNKSINYKVNDLAESTTYGKEALIYLEAVNILNDGLDSIISEQERELKEIESMVEDLNEYVNSLKETDQKTK